MQTLDQCLELANLARELGSTRLELSRERVLPYGRLRCDITRQDPVAHRAVNEIGDVVYHDLKAVFQTDPLEGARRDIRGKLYTKYGL